MKPISLFLFCFCFLSSIQAQQTTMYRLILSDKGNSSYSIERPEEFLSQKSIDRRTRQGFVIDETDLPIDPSYFAALIETGATIQTYSKWVNTIVIRVSSPGVITAVSQLPFVASYYPVWRGNLPSSLNNETSSINKVPQGDLTPSPYFDNYGAGAGQIYRHNGHQLHNLGFKGENMTIAVLDGGFDNANHINYFDQNKILGVKNFTHEEGSPLVGTLDHGTRVLSCMLTNTSGEFIGTAPMANYYLFKTEVNSSEYPVEEDYWVAGLEYADSLGVDLVTTSLGYFFFDDATMNHTISQLDGVTVPASRAASMGVSKGMILLCAAGNEGNNVNWRKIIFPSDAVNIITVGSVANDSVRSSFSSLGFTSDDRVKPDVMATGSSATVIGTQGFITYSNGTSFACPIMAGITACLWQALPHLNSLEIVSLLREAGNRYENPTPEYGYGIPDVYKAFLQAPIRVSFSPFEKADNRLKIDSNSNRIYIDADDADYSGASFSVYDCLGLKLLETSSGGIDISRLKGGIYIACFQHNDKKVVQKFVKR